MQKTKQAKSPRPSPSKLQQYEYLAGGAGVGGFMWDLMGLSLGG